MKTKDHTVQCAFHPMLTDFLFQLDAIHLSRGGDLVITSGSEPGGHSFTSLHHAIPCCAADVRSWLRVGWSTGEQYDDAVELAETFCAQHPMLARGDIEVIDEGDHFHIELQPKRRT